jgi:hypothetical protein
MPVWLVFPTNIPADGSYVWIRIKYYYSEPFKAVWDLTSQTFVSVDNSIVYPAWSVARWRSL